MSDALAQGLRSGNIRDLARAITLTESTRADHQQRARAILAELLPHTGGAIRVGISGAPGVGKSTFIESLGLYLRSLGHRVAVLAVDPSSTVSGGSILGDKTRMERLSQDPGAFIRPSPAAGSLGGVAARTREALLLCEAAGYEVVLVETVGVGQSEVAVAGMTDSFLLLQLPTAGDELQAIKKGIVELADIIVYNKADLAPKAAAYAAAQMRGALSMLRPTTPLWTPQVLVASATESSGIVEAWEAVLAHRAALDGGGELTARRQRQALAWMQSQIDDGLRANFYASNAVRAALPELSRRVATGQLEPGTAAAELLAMHSALPTS